MYTRHVNIPKNYNGVRFQRQSGEDIPVKEHRPSYNEGIKSSHSPLYNQKIANPVDEIELEPLEGIVEEELNVENITEENPDTKCDISDKCDNMVQEINEEETNKPLPASRLFSELPIGNILSSINKEELLILGLILLLATDKDGGNNDILTMLSLLLLKHK